MNICMSSHTYIHPYIHTLQRVGCSAFTHALAIYIYICIYIYIYISSHAYIHDIYDIYIHTHLITYRMKCLHTRVVFSIPACQCGCIYQYVIYTNVHIYIYTYMFSQFMIFSVHRHTYIHTYIHTYTHAQIYMDYTQT
jgi:hypothetical protein